jgi:dihydroneopterin aldolase
LASSTVPAEAILLDRNTDTHAARRLVTSYALRVRGLRLQRQVGVSEAERSLPQELVLDADVELPGRSFPAADELEQAADYGEVVRVATEAFRDRPVRLLETYAAAVAQRLGERFAAAERIRVAVTKVRVPVDPAPDEARVEITLGAANERDLGPWRRQSST